MHSYYLSELSYRIVIQIVDMVGYYFNLLRVQKEIAHKNDLETKRETNVLNVYRQRRNDQNDEENSLSAAR